MVQEHKIKIDPKYFDDVAKRRKTFEVRKNDRAYKVDDILDIYEYDRETGEYTGRYIWGGNNIHPGWSEIFKGWICDTGIGNIRSE